MIVDVIKTKLGAIEQAIQVPVETHAELASVVCLAVRQAVDKIEIIDDAAVELREIRTQVAPDTKTQHHLLAIADREVIGAECRTGWVRVGVVPLELVEQFEAGIFGCAHRQPSQVLRDQGFTKLCAG